MAHCGILHLASAQVLNPKIVPALGRTVTVNNVSMSYTVGQTATSTVTTGNRQLSQGFLQPEVQIRTGNIQGTYCPGNAISIPFQAFGIIGSNNIFTAQLSNSNGSFTNPTILGAATGNSSGVINATIPFGTATGSGYRIRVVSSLPNFTGTDNGTNLVIDPFACNTYLTVKLYIEGYYQSNGSLAPSLFNQGVLSNSSISDIILVELHSANPPYSTVDAATSFLYTNGTALCLFSAPPGNYFVSVKHRSALETWSASTITITPGINNYDFSINANKAFGDNQIEIASGKWAFFSGDINQDGSVDAFDYILLDQDIIAGYSGYFSSDLNGDGVVDAFDYILLDPHVVTGISSVKP